MSFGVVIVSFAFISDFTDGYSPVVTMSHVPVPVDVQLDSSLTLNEVSFFLYKVYCISCFLENSFTTSSKYIEYVAAESPIFFGLDYFRCFWFKKLFYNKC